MNQLILLYTTVANKINAEHITQHLLEQKLIACAQIMDTQ